MSANTDPAARQYLPVDPSDALSAALEAEHLPLETPLDSEVDAARRQTLLEEARAVHGDLGSKDDWVLEGSSEASAIVIKALRGDRDYYRKLAEHDKLTGLVNQETWRNLLLARLKLEQPTGVIMLDLNNFKRVNDEINHEVGDELIANFGAFLRGVFNRKEDIITEAPEQDDQFEGVPGRTGGDEFRILVDLSENNRRGENPYDRMDNTYAYLAENLATFVAALPKYIRDLGFNVAIGAAVSDPNSQLPFEEQLKVMLKQADESMYEDKETGKELAAAQPAEEPEIVDIPPLGGDAQDPDHYGLTS